MTCEKNTGIKTSTIRTPRASFEQREKVFVDQYARRVCVMCVVCVAGAEEELCVCVCVCVWGVGGGGGGVGGGGVGGGGERIDKPEPNAINIFICILLRPYITHEGAGWRSPHPLFRYATSCLSFTANIMHADAGNLRSQGINRHGIDPLSRNISNLARRD